MESVLVPSEIEFYIETMKPTELKNLGTKQWLEWHQRLQKLNQEAVIEASELKEEYVKETLVTLGKVPILVHEVILINIWKHKIFPILLNLSMEPDNTFVAYSIFYHEVVSVALLELVMFHPGGSEALGDSAPDLLEYAYDSAAQLLVTEHKEFQPSEKNSTEILRQRSDLVFHIGIRCLSLLRYFAEHLDRLPLCISDRIYNIHDAPVLLIEILLVRPWIKDGKLYKSGKWFPWDGEALGQSEAQVWLALCQLLLNAACITHYPITDSRRSQLMKLIPLITPTLLDQLSPVFDLKYWLYKLTISDQSCAPNKPIILETVLEVKEKILAQGNRKWKKIAKEQFQLIFGRSQKELMEIAQGLCEAYNTDLLEKFDTDPTNSCAVCGKGAIQRCSRCKNSWYCSRTCQVNDWTNHKVNCLETES